ncbi:serine/threonine protein kinase [Actinoplanes sp. TBRC 11911]|uniref:serine/threonine-protein kinase n=1 Tax=Actinoplanes sp. TBRC 11911 TaxID=2729386 RepID=UPI00145C4903|nr:serine/threonine-protein kinase [Actinoplanes sp. TBRC 11911]NMO52940.1 serine/threonine protein kinase [Actinoplanes sp. TBRC 11911]
MLAAGHLLGNRYRLDERIATGGMGDVWKGTDVVLGRVIAVKVLRSAMLTDPEFAARFYGEARMMAAFRHPGVVEVYDYASAQEDDEEQVAYLVMAYVEGEPLSVRVKQGPMPVTETMSIVAQAAEALHAAHEAGTVHRDVKPGNLIVRPTGAVVLVDFGVARSAQVTSVTAANAIVGTALYMAPEQVAKGNVSPATDIYALGAVAYHCIAGHPPFDGDNALQVALRHLEDEPDPLPDHVPPPVRELIARAMAKQPGDRFETAAEFAEAAYAAGNPMDWKRLSGTSLIAPSSPATPTRTVTVPREMPFSPAPEPLTGPMKRPPRSQKALLVAVVALLVLAGGLGVAVALSGNGDDKAKVGGEGAAPSASVPSGGPFDETLPPTDEPSFTQPAQPGGTPHTPRRTNSPSPSLSPSSTPSTSPTPAKTTPTSTPTTTPPVKTTEPSTPPTGTTPPPTPTDGGDGGGAGNAIFPHLGG